MNKIYLLRHGENRANLTKEFSSRKVDYSLTPKGRLQAQQAGEYLRTLGIHFIYASPLKRAAETAEIIGGILSTPVTIMENFRELDVGELEDMQGSPESWQFHNNVISAWMQGDLGRRFPGGEDCLDVLVRMRAGLEHILAGQEGRNLLVVGHGGLFMTTIQDICPGMDFPSISKDIPNCSIAEIAMAPDGRGWVGELMRWADASYLHGEAAQLVSGTP